jgi:hypothetical protein
LASREGNEFNIKGHALFILLEFEELDDVEGVIANAAALCCCWMIVNAKLVGPEKEKK